MLAKSWNRRTPLWNHTRGKRAGCGMDLITAVKKAHFGHWRECLKKCVTCVILAAQRLRPKRN